MRINLPAAGSYTPAIIAQAFAAIRSALLRVVSADEPVDSYLLQSSDSAVWTMSISTTGVLTATGAAGNTVTAAKLTLPGPYTNDAAAATAGVAIGESYRKAAGVVVWRVT